MQPESQTNVPEFPLYAQLELGVSPLLFFGFKSLRLSILYVLSIWLALYAIMHIDAYQKSFTTGSMLSRLDLKTPHKTFSNCATMVTNNISFIDMCWMLDVWVLQKLKTWLQWECFVQLLLFKSWHPIWCIWMLSWISMGRKRAIYKPSSSYNSSDIMVILRYMVINHGVCGIKY